jgi:glycogen debranching enzyme GlgX/4-alpha-glucanotransferase
VRAEAGPGAPEPLGATIVDGGANFAFPAPGAEAVHLCVFDAAEREVARIRLPGRTGEVHHGLVAGIEAGARYGLRVEGPWEPWRGHRFNPAKLLVDPWARRLDRPFRLHPALFDTADRPDQTDSAPFLPKAVLAPALPPIRRTAPRGPQVIYELLVKGFTATHPGVPEATRGTFAGLGHPAAVAHLRDLGVTCVELLPTAAWIDERHLPPLGLANAWGYNPAAFLAPDPRLAPGGMEEVRAAVAALQAAGIAVIQDVVFNHNGEGDHLGPTLSLKGLGNGTFFRVRPEDQWRYVDDSGCGNTLALDRPWPLRLAMDALRHWAEAAGLDGFRLDLATTLARGDGVFDAAAPLIQAMRQDPVLRDLLIVAEPWDIGPEGYQLGRFPPGWGEWNDRFRDDVRRFWRGDGGLVGAVAARMSGSAESFPARPLTDSVNFVAAHDGFTLADLVSYSAKRNHANGEENRDGTGANHSWNHGVEGPTDDPAITARRRADIRALLATLLTARGTPMLGMGDEGGRSQGGNNNAYAQDNATTWLDWPGIDRDLVAFTRRLIAARRAHPALTDPAPLTGEEGPDGLPDVAWLREDGAPMDGAAWSDPDRRALVALLHAAGDRCLVALNAGDALPLALPAPRPGFRWRLLADSADPARDGPVEVTTLPARAVLLLAEERREARREDHALLHRLAEAAGISTVWHEISGTRHEVPEGTLRALLSALGHSVRNEVASRESLATLAAPPAMPVHLTARSGAVQLPLPLAERATRLRMRLEGGEERILDVAPEDGATERVTLPDGRAAARRLLPLHDLPDGRHLVLDEATPDRACQLAVVPARCFLPDGMEGGARRFGIAAQIYALRHDADQGIGDFRAVAEMAAAASREGAALLGLSPPHALFPTDRSRTSPYSPSDRRFLEPLFIDVTRLPLVGDLAAVREALSAAEGRFAALREGSSADHPGAWIAKRGVLEAAWTALPPDHPARAALDAFRREGGAALERFCIFNAIAEKQGHPDTRRWPIGLRHGDHKGVPAFAARNADRVGFFAFLQMLADLQLAEAGRAGAGLYRDLAVGAAPDGAEIWSGDGRFLPGFSVGAPPDPLGPDGQVWGLPPPDPRHAHATGHAAFARLIRANMRHAAALRIDHVLGLRRLFLVPEGAKGAEGAYLDYPLDEMLGQIALESQRARCLVVGEDLGTVPPGMGAALQGAGVLSYRVLWFERQGERFNPPERYPARAAACVSTHDLPTLAGYWSGEDIAERVTLGLMRDEAASRAERAADRAAMLALLEAEGLLPEGATPDGPMDEKLAAAIHELVARTPSALMLVQTEDLAGETVAVNLPGTSWERPNWRRRLPVTAEGLVAMSRAKAVLGAIRGLRPG